ncbi:MAG: glycosyltransferase [Bacteroidota bacterium]|nr:glycosyltransferase [Bacteroidota bacterium]
MPAPGKEFKGSVCFFNTNKDWGGGEKWSLTAATKLRERHYNVLIIANKKSELLKRSEKAGLNTASLKMRATGFLNPFLMWRIKNIYKTNNVKAVFLNLSIDLKTGGRMAAWAGVPKIIYRRGMARPIRGNRQNRHLLSKVVTDIIATSEDTKRGILQNLSGALDPGKIHIIYNGVELPDIDKKANHNKKMTIGVAGRVSYEKGYASLVELGSILEDKGIDFEIILAGEGDKLKEIKNKVSKAGLESRFNFPGFITDMDQFYRSINILVLPSEKEGFANVLLESMSYGKPPIAFDIGSPSELIVDGQHGFIVEKNNIEAMAERISQLYNNPEMLDKMGGNARQRIKEGFSLEGHVDRIEKIIQLQTCKD